LLAVWLCGLPILGLLLGFDDWLRSHRPWFPNPLGSRVALVISGSANGAFLLPLLAVAALGFHRRGRGQTARTLTVLLLSGILAGLVGTTLRSIIGRTRPDVAVEQGWFGPRKDGRWLVGKYAYGSFPSGHVSLAAGVGFMAFAAGRRAGLAGSVYGVAVAWSRFHLGAHRASDAWAGLLVGGTITVLLWSPCLAWIRSRHRPRGWPRRWAFPGESRTSKPSWEH
jgi:membrane-associated phospholipid phosphatase